MHTSFDSIEISWFLKTHLATLVLISGRVYQFMDNTLLFHWQKKNDCSHSPWYRTPKQNKKKSNDSLKFLSENWFKQVLTSPHGCHASPSLNHRHNSVHWDHTPPTPHTTFFYKSWPLVPLRRVNRRVGILRFFEVSSNLKQRNVCNGLEKLFCSAYHTCIQTQAYNPVHTHTRARKLISTSKMILTVTNTEKCFIVIIIIIWICVYMSYYKVKNVCI